VESLDLVEPSPNLGSILAARFGASPRVRVFDVSLEDYLREASPESYDAAVLVNVLEHIADDAGALLALRRVLRPGGHLLIFVPALSMLYSRFDRIVGHHRRYHINALLPEIRSAGFDIVSGRYFDLIGTLPWLILNRVLGATKLNPAMMSAYDKFIIPISRMFETAIKPPFGKNIILVARRKRDASVSYGENGP
jgi:SAM-dependent methyltransferase